MTFDATTIQMLITGIGESLFMTLTSSVFSYLIGIPLGIILIVTDKDGIYPIPWLQQILGLIINLFRSIPFIILLIMVIPVTKIIVGTLLGPKAVIPPLVIAAAPYVARVVESSFKEVDSGVIEAAKSMAGFVGGGGLGDIAIRYGYYRYQTQMMFVTVAILVIIVQIIQETGMRLSKKSDKRVK